jgi:hypothetical protein
VEWVGVHFVVEQPHVMCYFLLVHEPMFGLNRVAFRWHEVYLCYFLLCL